MLPQQEITKFLEKHHNTEFIAQINVYPMLLWVTVLCDAQFSLTRWLSYFLDMKDNRGQKIVRTLADIGYYHLLLFAIEKPTYCTHVMTLTLTAKQRQQLADWLAINQESNELISSKEAKNILKAEYERLKLQVSQKLKSNQQTDKVDFKYLVSRFFDKFRHFLVYHN
jgi:eukaryotic-like serine/threonine-protein kinase